MLVPEDQFMFLCAIMKIEFVKRNKLPVAGNPLLILLGYYISISTTCFLLDDEILLESLDLHSGSSMN